MRVSLLGASGKVGREALHNLILDNQDRNLELVLVAQNTDRIKGIIGDINSAASLITSTKSKPLIPLKTTISSDITSIANSDLVMMCVGRWPSAEEKKLYDDSSGRLAQSYANMTLVRQLSSAVGKHAPDAHVVVVTNQSDMMAQAAREILPPERVLGLGGIVDSARFRMILARNIPVQNESEILLGKGNHIIGFHDDMMIYLKSSLSHAASLSVLDSALKETRAYGATISRLQKDFNFPDLSTGSCILPGYAVSSTIQAFTGQLPAFEESFNICLPPATAQQYGVEEGTALSVPVKIGLNQYKPSSQYIVLSSESQQLKEAQQTMAALYAELNNQRPDKKPAFNLQ